MMERSFKTISENLRRITAEIEETAIRAGRDPADVHLMAVTKTVPPEYVNMAVECGVKLLGENRVQELLGKYDSYRKDGVDIHFIGHLQTNKVRQIVDKVSMVHSVDSEKLARELDRQCGLRDKVMDVLLEVNIAGEASKSGVPPEEAERLAEIAGELPGLRLRGLMTIPPFDATEAENDRCFERMGQLLVDIGSKNIDNVTMEILSMGMSGDYLQAIRHGATIVRVGSAIFGSRA